MNVDAKEIKHFQQQAAQWWDSKGPLRTLHHINPVRLAYIAQQSGGLSGKTVLDIGCGGGVLTEAMAAVGANALGIDLASDALAAGADHAAQTGVAVHYQTIAAEDLAKQRPGEFAVVTCMEMLEHVPDPASIVAAAAALAAPGGTVIFSTLNRKPKSFALAILGAEYLLGLVPKGTHDYGKFIKPSELSHWARAAGLEPIDITGMSYNPLTQLAKLGSDLDVNYFLTCKKP